MNNWCICWFFMHPLNAELNPICHFLALLGGASIVVVSRLRVKDDTPVVRVSVYAQLNVQLDVFVYVFFILRSTCFGCYLHPSSGAQLQRTAIGVFMVLVC